MIPERSEAKSKQSSTRTLPFSKLSLKFFLPPTMSFPYYTLINALFDRKLLNNLLIFKQKWDGGLLSNVRYRFRSIYEQFEQAKTR